MRLSETTTTVNGGTALSTGRKALLTVSIKNEKLNGGITADTAGIVKLALRRGYHQHVIASYFHDNQGRVSETKAGKRYADVPIASELPADFPAYV